MKISRLLRIIHRDLGFFTVGFTLVYAVSGIILNHLSNKDPAFRVEAKTVQLTANLTESELADAWHADKNLPALIKVTRMDESRLRLLIKGGTGVYQSSSGSLYYEKNEKRVLVYWINRLHYNKVKGWSPIADFFAGSLILLAITGLFIVKGKRGIAGSGKWYLLIGILIPILFGILMMR